MVAMVKRLTLTTVTRTYVGSNPTSHHIKLFRRCSSAGYSTRLISVLSGVQVPAPPPIISPNESGQSQKALRNQGLFCYLLSNTSISASSIMNLSELRHDPYAAFLMGINLVTMKPAAF